MIDKEYLVPTEKCPVFIAHCDYFGYVNSGLYPDWFVQKDGKGGGIVGKTFALSYREGVSLLLDFIEGHRTERPNTAYELFMIEGKIGKHERVVYEKVYSLSEGQAKKYMLKNSIDQQKNIAMNTKELLKRIEEIFNEKLEAKTGWGRNEIKSLHQAAVNEGLMELADTLSLK